MRKSCLFAAALSLSACNGTGEVVANSEIEAPELPGEGSVEDNALQPVDEGDAGSPREGPDSAIDEKMEWRFSEAATGPALSYGEPQTDHVRLSLSCDGDMARLSFMRSAEVVRARPDALSVESGGMTWKSEISAESSELGGMTVEALIPLSAGTMTAFAAGNPMALHWGGETIRVPPTDQAGRFTDACG